MALETRDDGRPADKIVQAWTLLGELSLILQGKHQVTAIARQPTTVLKISREMFLKVLEQNPPAAAQLCELFRSRLAQFREHLKLDPES